MQASYRSVVVVDPSRPIFAHFLETKRWVPRIFSPEPKLLLCLLLDLARESREFLAKRPGNCRFHRVALPLPLRFPSQHSSRPHPTLPLSHPLRTLGPQHLLDAPRSNAPSFRIAPVGAIRWLLRFRSTNSRSLISLNRAAIARIAVRPIRNGAAVIRLRKWQLCYRTGARFNASMGPLCGFSSTEKRLMLC